MDSYITFAASLFIGMNVTREYTCTLKFDCMCSIMAKKLRRHLDLGVTEPMQCTMHMPREGNLLIIIT